MTPHTLTESECIRLIEELNSLRDRLLVLLMLDAGLRVGELVQLKRSDLWPADATGHTLYVRPEIAKGGQARFLPLTARVQVAIAKMADAFFCSAEISTDLFVFANSSGNGHLSTRQVERIIKIGAIRSINRPANPHMLRHTFASRLMRITNARGVQELLGHKKLSSTQIYTHPNSDDLTKAIDSLNSKGD